jgi:hypothetical protein
MSLSGAEGVLHKYNRVHVTTCMVFCANWIQHMCPVRHAAIGIRLDHYQLADVD